MLVHFSIDPDSLECNIDDVSISVALHRRIIQEWRRNGILVHSHCGLRESSILKAVEALPQECRKLWKTALAFNRRRPSLVDWDGFFPSNAISEMHFLSSEFKVALLDPTRAIVVGGLSANESTRIEPTLNGMELCKVHAVSESTIFQEADALATRPLPAGVDCGSQWRSRYTSYLQHAQHIVLVDRYILANHMWRKSRGSVSGLNRLLDDCFKRNRSSPVSVKIICALQNDQPVVSASQIKLVDDFFVDLASTYAAGGIRQIECIVLADKEFSKCAHARYFRADYSVFGIDSGIDIFGGDISERSSIIWRQDVATSNHFTEQEASLQVNFFKKTELL
jgi:hypothetical protein